MPTFPAGALGQYVNYENKRDGTGISSYFVTSRRAGKSPAIIMLRGMAGPDSGYTEIADRLAEEGYCVLIHGWMVRGNDPTDSVLIEDIKCALEFLRTRPEVDQSRLGIFGYCKGGGQALIAAGKCPEVKVVVAFHGFARRPGGATPDHGDPHDVALQLASPILLLHGEQDQVSPVASMQEMHAALKVAGKQADLHIYPGADHGFAVSTHKGFKADDATESYKRAVAFLAQHLC